jgi:hypothetical protein
MSSPQIVQRGLPSPLGICACGLLCVHYGGVDLVVRYTVSYPAAVHRRLNLRDLVMNLGISPLLSGRSASSGACFCSQGDDVLFKSWVAA